MPSKGQSSGNGVKTPPGEQKKSGPIRKPGPGRVTARTIKAAAVKLGVPVARLKIARDSGCDAFRDGGRIDLDLLAKWLAENKPVAPTGETLNLEVERALDTRAARQLKEEKLKKNRGEVFSKNEVNHEWVTNIITAKNLLQDSANEMVVEMQMKSVINANCVDSCRDILSRRIRSALKVLNSGKFSRPICPNCQHEIKGDAPWVDSKPVEQTHNDGTGI